MCLPPPPMHPLSGPPPGSPMPGKPIDWIIIAAMIATLIALTAFMSYGLGHVNGRVEAHKREVRQCLRHEERQVAGRYGGVVRIENVCVEWRITR